MPDDQTEVIAFLSSGCGDPGGGPVTVVQTHGALVFLAGDTALKIKRAVRYDYMDLSTLALRETMLRRELALNHPAAPKIYRDVLPVTREASGVLAMDGVGRPVEWVLRMWRFPASDELAVIAESGGLTDALARDLGQAVHAYHAAAPRRAADGASLIEQIAQELARVFADMGDALGPVAVAQFHAAAVAALTAVAQTLTRRGVEGHVRRCHGDLHLRNLVLIDGKPVPFDALEFDETLGTCDVLYDLAFLLMDLHHRGLGRAANIVLNTYLLAARGGQDSGLVALPLFVALRAAIRAMVIVQTDRACGTPLRCAAEAQAYLANALAAFAPPPARLIAIGGLSGTGKTVLAGALCPDIGPMPGAVHLRSDLERKAALTVAPQTHLPAGYYTGAARDRVYGQMFARAQVLLQAGRAVVLDATFIDPGMRRRAVQLAADLGLPFTGLWLEAPADALIARVRARVGDASDADETVVRDQIARDAGPLDWHRLAAGGPPASTLTAALALLA